MKKKQSIEVPNNCRVLLQKNSYIFSGSVGKTILDANQCDGCGNRFRTNFQSGHIIKTATVDSYVSISEPYTSFLKTPGRKKTFYKKKDSKNPFPESKGVFSKMNTMQFVEKTPFDNKTLMEKKFPMPRQGSLRGIEAKMNGAAYGYVLFLKLIGLGYKFSLYPSQKKKLFQILSIKSGQSHKIKFFIPQSVGIFLYPRNTLALWSTEEEIIANLGYQIRHVRPPTPYKGKGIRFLNESIVLKEGKKIK